MSTTVDQRVVEMRFDNKQFESGVATTMSTLDKLKQKLKFDGAAKGLENVGDATKRVDMKGLGNAIDVVTARFSALQVMGVTTLANITNSAVNAGKKIIKSLTIEPITSGFSEYETKMGSIQTILANTEHQGTTLDDVTAALDKLNTYADKTIYNFQQMTKNIGTFTAAGVDLDTSVASIQGIANLAAVSGSTSQQASTAMYQLSQALASGTVKLQDWNSVVNAGMGGKVFQNALIRTAAALDDASNDVEAWQKKNIDAYGSFRESLTKSGWLTTDVLTKTLEQFTMAAEEGSEEWNNFKKSLMSDGYTEKQAEEILKMANTATDAATKVKTFTQLMDTLKESAQSGWAQTWELIIGDFEEAKAFFTELSDIFGAIINTSAERRNNLFSDALTSNWDKLIARIGEAGIKAEDYKDSIEKIVGDDKIKSLVTEYGSLEKAARRGAITADVLKSALDEVANTNADEKISGFVDGLKDISRTLKNGNVGEDVKKLQTALDALGYDLGSAGVDGIIGKYTEGAIKAFQEANGLLADGIAGPETIAALEAAGKKVQETAKDVEGLKSSCGDLVDVITETSGRELLLDSLMNVIKAIQRPLSALGEALRDTFSISPDQLYNGLKKLNKFTKSFVMKGVLDVDNWEDLSKNISNLGINVDDFITKVSGVLTKNGVDVDALRKKYGNLGVAFEKGAISFDVIKEALLSFDGITESLINGGEAAEKVRQTFAGLFAIVEIIATVLSGPLKLAFNIATKVFKNLGTTLLDVTAGIGNGIVRARDSINKVIDTITDFISKHIAKWIEEFRETEMFKNVAEWFSDASETISKAIDNITQKFENFSTSSIANYANSIYNFLAGLASGLKNSETFMTVVDTVCGAFKALEDNLPKFKLPELNFDNVKLLTGFLGNFEGTSGIMATFSNISNWVKDKTVLKAKDKFKEIFSMDWLTFKSTALSKFASFWNSSGEAIKAGFEACKNVLLSIKEFIFGTEDVDLPTILNVAEKFLGIIVLIKLLKLLNTFASPFDNVTSAIENLASRMKWEAIGGAFKAMALALGTVTACIVILASMKLDEAWDAVKMLGVLLLGMVAAIGVMTFMTSKLDAGLDTTGVAIALLTLVGSIYLMTKVLEQIDGMKLKNPAETFMSLALMMLGLAAGIKIIAAAGSSSFKSVAAILTLVTALKMMLDVITAYSEFPWAGTSKGIQKMIEMLMVLSVAINIASRGLKSSAGAKGLAMLLLAMVVSLKILIDVIKEYAAMDTDALVKGGAVVVALLGVMTWMMVEIGAANKGSVLEKGQRSANNFVGLATALLAVVAAIWLLGKMDIHTLTQGGIAVIAILLSFTGMIASIGKATSGLGIGSILAMTIAIGALMLEMSLIIHTMKDIPWQQSLGSAGAIIALMLAMAAMLKIVSGVKIDPSDLTPMVGAIGMLTVIITMLSFVLSSMDELTPTEAIGNAAALGLILIAMAGALKILNGIKIDSANMIPLIGAMAGLSMVTLMLTVVLQQLQGLKPGESVGNVIALGVLMAAMAGVLAIINRIKVNANTVGSLVLLTAMVVPLAVLTGILQAMNGVENAIVNATALSILALALAVAMIPIAAAGKLAGKGLAAGVIALAGTMAATNFLVTALQGMSDVKNATENAKALAILASALSLCMIPLGAVGKLAGVGSFVGVAALAGLMLSLYYAVDVLARMDELQNASANANVLGGLVTTLTKCLVPLSIISVLIYPALVAVGALELMMRSLNTVVDVLQDMDGLSNAESNAGIIERLMTALSDIFAQITSASSLAIGGVVALNLLIGVIEKLTVFTAFVGKLMDNNDKLEGFINKGLDTFKRLAEGLGEMVSAFLEGATSGLEEVGQNLTDFIVAALPFIAIVQAVNDKVATGAGNLIKAVGLFLAADFVADLLSTSGVGLTSLGADLSAFAKAIIPFVAAMSKVDADTATGVTALCDAINALTSANLKDAITQILPGDNSLSTFGESIETFAGCMRKAAISLKNITENDVENIKRGATAGLALADLSAAIPRQGGLIQDIIGSQDMATFGESAEAFADCIVSYSKKVSGQNIDADAITKSATAGQALADLNSAIPADGGWADDILGSQDMATFGESIVSFADYLVQYSNKVAEADLDTEAITKSAEAAGALAELNGNLPSQNGLWEAVVGEQDLGVFGSQLVSFANGLVTYSNAASLIDDAKIEAIKNSGLAVDELVTVMDKVPESGGWGDAIFGASDGQSFGAALVSVANGIVTYCTVASQIPTDLSVITNSGTAITNLKTVFESMPSQSTIDKSTYLSIGMSNFMLIAQKINELSTAGYDYSGIDALKTPVNTIATMLSEINLYTMSDDMNTLLLTVNDAVSAATNLGTINGNTYTGVGTFKTALKNLAETDVAAVVSAFTDQTAAVGTAVAGFVQAIVDGFGNNSSEVIASATEVVEVAADQMASMASDFTPIGEEFVENLADGISDNVSVATKEAKSMAGDAADAAEEKYSDFSNAGRYLVDGFGRGIRDRAWYAENMARNMAQKALEAAREELQVNSPSKVFRRLGYSVPEGFAQGIDRMSGVVETAAGGMANSAIDNAKNTVARIASAISTDIDAQPTIRPVLDLSDVRSGAGAIGGMFGGTSVGVMANVGAISYGMSRYGQNGTNNDVINAINKLNKKLDNIGNTTYSINGVTYDDGSNIRDAVSAIVRQARIERRV